MNLNLNNVVENVYLKAGGPEVASCVDQVDGEDESPVELVAFEAALFAAVEAVVHVGHLKNRISIEHQKQFVFSFFRFISKY